jgi:hypothetical protein
MSLVGTALDRTQADTYLQKALKPLVNLLLRKPSITLIQALIGVAILVQTSPYSEPVSIFISTAVRMAQDLRYNELGSHEKTTSPEALQQKYVFWIAFFMDMDLTMLTGSQPRQRLDELDIQTPMPWRVSNETGIIMAMGGESSIPIFSLHKQLALLQAEAYEQLFSVQGRKKTTQQLVACFHNLLSKFQTYRKHRLFQCELGDLTRSLYRSGLVHVTILEASYFWSIYRLHAAAILGWHTPMDVFELKAVLRVAPSVPRLLYQDAERILGMSALGPQGDQAVSW